MNKEKAIEKIKNGEIRLQELPPKLKDDKDVVLTALSIKKSDIQYASPRLQRDWDVIYKILQLGQHM